MVRLQKLYSKFKAIESGSAVTEVTEGVARGTVALAVGHREHRSLQHALASVLPAGPALAVPASRGRGVRRPRQTGHAHQRTMNFMGYSAARGRRPAAPRPGQCTPGQQLRTGPSLPIAAGFSVRRPVYGEPRSGSAVPLPLLPPRHGRLLH